MKFIVTNKKLKYKVYLVGEQDRYMSVLSHTSFGGSMDRWLTVMFFI